MILFFKQETGELVGSIWIDTDGNLTTQTLSLVDYINGWDGPAKEFIKYFDGYANAYMYAKRSES